MFVVDSQKHSQPRRRSSVGPDNIHPHHLQPSEPTKQGSGAALVPQNLPGLPPHQVLCCHHRDMVFKWWSVHTHDTDTVEATLASPISTQLKRGWLLLRKLEAMPKSSQKKTTKGGWWKAQQVTQNDWVRRETLLKERRWLVTEGFRNHHCDSKLFTLMAELHHYSSTLPNKINSAGRFKQGQLTILLLQINLCFKGKTWS